ncbi:hypothetical protein MJO28_013233, partial [Puccinia striiformis f. sp. tritici]
RPFKCVNKYLGQHHTREKQSNWHKFQKTDPLAQEALHNILSQPHWASATKMLQRSINSTSRLLTHRIPRLPMRILNHTIFSENYKSKKTLKKKLRRGLKRFNESLVLAAQDHQKPLFFQGGGFLGDDYLRALIAKGDPMRKFAVWTAGLKATKNKVESKAKKEDKVHCGCFQKPRRLSSKQFYVDCLSTTVTFYRSLGRYTKVAKSKTTLTKKSGPGTNTALNLAWFLAILFASQPITYSMCQSRCYGFRTPGLSFEVSRTNG